MPRSSASGLTSSSFTGTPALANTMAMPPPIRPGADHGRRCGSGRGFTLAGMSGIFRASRSAKK